MVCYIKLGHDSFLSDSYPLTSHDNLSISFDGIEPLQLHWHQ